MMDGFIQVIAMCILRKAYETSSLWSKWVLLASLDELLGKPAPLLNETQLHALLGITLNSNKDIDNDKDKFDNYYVTSPNEDFICSKCKSIIHVSNKDIQCNLTLENSLTSKSPLDYASLDSLPTSLQSSLYFSVDEIEKVDKISEEQTNGVGIINSRVALLNQNEMTEFKKETKFLRTFEGEEKCNNVQAIGNSQCTQTDVVSTIDISVNTEFPYKLRKISDPNIKLRYNITKTAFHQYRLLASKDKIKLFHGRPLIVRNSSMKPALIPLQRLVPDLNVGDLCLDPRGERPKTKDKISLSLEEVNNSLMDISSCDDSFSNVKEEANENNSSDKPSPVRHLHDY